MKGKKLGLCFVMFPKHLTKFGMMGYIIQSECGDMIAGVHQGSVLGPLLFLVYVNDIVNVVNCGIKLFADDTLIYKFDDGQTNLTISLNQNLEI